MKYLPADLTDFIEEVATITCTSCGAEDDIHGTGNEEEEFFKRGWRATFENCYCPKCAAKKLKTND